MPPMTMPARVSSISSKSPRRMPPRSAGLPVPRRCRGSDPANPLVYKGVMYLTFGATTVAIDATTCRQIWAYSWPLQGHIISPTNRGVAIKDGKLVRGVADGHLIALDLATGALLWSQPIASATNGQYLSMPPLIWGDMVIYGPAGADYGAQNWIGAFKLENGAPLWRFYLVPKPGQPGASSWKDRAP